MVQITIMSIYIIDINDMQFEDLIAQADGGCSLNNLDFGGLKRIGTTLRTVARHIHNCPRLV